MKREKINHLYFISFIVFFSYLILNPSSCLAVKPPILQKIMIEGNQFFKEKRIKENMTNKENKWYNILNKRRLKRWELEKDQYRIEGLYNTYGFLEAKIKLDYKISEKDKAKVFVKIEEGVQTMLEDISLTGGIEKLKPKAFKILEEFETDKFLNPAKIEKAKFLLKTLYANNGYPYAEIRTSVKKNKDKTKASVIFEITSGPLVSFGEVFLKGLKHTKEKVAKRELTIKKGQIYSRKKIVDSQKRVYSTNLFNYISLDAKEPEKKPLNPDFTLKVVEKKSNFFGLRMGVSQTQPANFVADLTTLDLLAEWGNRNLFGTGRKISFSGFSSFEIVRYKQNLSNRFSLKFFEPWFLGKRILFDLDLYYEPGIKSILQDYKIQSYGGNLNFSKELSNFIKGWFTFSYQRINIFDVPPEKIEDIKKELGINIRRKFILMVERDSRENIFVPVNGSLTRIYAEQVGGFLKGDHHFLKFIFSWARYKSLGKPGFLNVLATRLRFGYIKRIKKGEYVPTFDRFYLGGASTIRGYAENTLGPKDENGDPKGGKVMIIGNLELRRGLFWKFGYTFFADFGNIWFESEDVNLDDYKLTAGVGLQFFTPIGPLRLDYARRIIRREDPVGTRLHLSILYAF